MPERGGFYGEGMGKHKVVGPANSVQAATAGTGELSLHYAGYNTTLESSRIQRSWGGFRKGVKRVSGRGDGGENTVLQRHCGLSVKRQVTSHWRRSASTSQKMSAFIWLWGSISGMPWGVK